MLAIIQTAVEKSRCQCGQRLTVNEWNDIICPDCDEDWDKTSEGEDEEAN